MIKYIIIGVLVITSFVGGFFVNRSWDSEVNSQLTQQIQVIEQQKADIDAERSKLREEIKVKDEQAAVKELEVAQLHSLISARTSGLADEQKKIEDAVKKYEDEINTINIPTDNYTRCLRLCDNRAKLGYKCSENFCSQYK